LYVQVTALEKGQQEQQGSSKKSFSTSPSLDELVAVKGLRKASRDTIPVPQDKNVDEAELNEKKSDESGVVRWLQILAAVGIPLVLVYLALVGLVNPQFAEIRDIVDSNRDAIAANTSSIERLAAKFDSSVERLDAKIDSSVERLDAKIDLIAELLILAATNEDITEGELRNLLNAGER